MAGEDKRTILQLIRQYLTASRKLASRSSHEVAPLPPGPQADEPIDRDELARQLVQELTHLGAHAFSARSTSGAQGFIRDVIHRHQARRIAISAAPALQSLSVETLIDRVDADIITLPDGSTADGLEAYKRDLMAADLGITGAEYGLADSGTLVIRTSETEGRLASLLPPVHLAILSVDRILPDLAALIARIERPLDASDWIFITGPSRTADIELTLTVGVHGPKELYVLLLE